VGLIFTSGEDTERLASRLHDDNSADLDLSRFDEAFQRAKLKDSEAIQEELPDGYYETVVEEVRLTKTPRTNNPMLVWKLRVSNEEFEGRILNKRRVITDKTLGFLKEDLERCGVHLLRLSDLPARLADMFGLKATVMKKTKEQWTDVYFVKVEREQPDQSPF
jgi:hypothetical protein